MLPRTASHYWGVVLEAPDAVQLGRFYARLLGWPIVTEKPDWVTLAPPGGVEYLACQSSPDYVAPVWPAAAGQQQMMLHLDLEVGELDAAVAEAIDAGARLAEFQPQERVRVMLDPAGHPFCLYVDELPGDGSAEQS
ncbi:MAG TPA: VOC family protein [Micromonosporaceae bacterium]